MSMTMGKELPDNHISILSQNKIQEICRELFAATGINYFIFARFYDNGDHISFPSHADWHQYFWEKGYHKSSHLRLKTGSHLWQSTDRLRQANCEAREKFGIDHKFEIVVRGKNYYDVFGFAAPTHCYQVLEVYLNQLSLLKKFMLHFMDRGASLIKLGEKKENRLKIPHHYVLPQCQQIPSLLCNFRVRRFHFPCVSLSEREVQSLAWLLRGRTAKETGKMLNVSRKTVESYIDASKNKLDCNSRTELFDKAYEIGIMDIMTMI